MREGNIKWSDEKYPNMCDDDGQREMAGPFEKSAMILGGYEFGNKFDFNLFD